MDLLKPLILGVVSVVGILAIWIMTPDIPADPISVNVPLECLECKVECEVTKEQADIVAHELFCALSIFIEFHEREELSDEEALESAKVDKLYERAAFEVWLRYGDHYEEQSCY